MQNDNDNLDHHCPLLNKGIDSSDCYEIASVAAGLCKPSLVNNITDRKTAQPICEKCENWPM